MNHNYKFLSDDIVVVDGHGTAWPNFAFPKIYAYNVVNNPEIRERLFRDMGPIDRLHWATRQQLAPASLRRRINPEKLYDGTLGRNSPLRRYVILVRDNTDAIYSRPISIELATELSLSILKTEYGVFFQHLHWHQVNRNIQGREPILTVARLFERWRELLPGILEGVTCEAIHVPQSVDHIKFRRDIIPFLTGNGPH